MGARDIMPFVSASGGHHRIISWPVGASTSANTADTSWREGEVVEVTVASGDIDVTPNGSAVTNLGLVYLAAGSSEGLLRNISGASAADGDADGQMAPCYSFDVGVEFITRNVFNNSDTNIGPAGTNTGFNVGDTVGLWRDDTNPGPVSGEVNGDFGIDLNTTGMIITRVLDSQGDDISVSGNTADKVVFMAFNET